MQTGKRGWLAQSNEAEGYSYVGYIGIAMAAIVMLSGCSTPDFAVSPVAAVDGVRLSEEKGVNSYALGKRYLLNGMYGEAISYFKRHLKSDPESVSALNGIAICYDQLGRFGLSRQYYDYALAIDPDSAQTFNNIGRSYLAQGRDMLAAKYLLEAQHRNPEAPEIQANVSFLVGGLSYGGGFSEPDSQLLGSKEAISALTAGLSETNVSDRETAGNDMNFGDRRPKRNSGNYVQQVTLSGRSSDVSAPPSALAVSNGAGRRGMARRMAQYIEGRGFAVNQVTNSNHFRQKVSRIRFTPGNDAQARAVAALFPVHIPIEAVVKLSTELRLELGGDLLAFDRQILNHGRM